MRDLARPSIAVILRRLLPLTYRIYRVSSSYFEGK